MPADPYNPLDKLNLGQSIVTAMLAGPCAPLPTASTPRFVGAGVYAIYYSGPFPAYASVSKPDCGGDPIYVGKAIPSGGRQGSFGLAPQVSNALYNRLKEHAGSLAQAQNLELADFACRYLVVDDIWIPLGESLLIAQYQPVWNSVVDGFGNHPPGTGRAAGRRPLWDELHPGRPWANALPAPAMTTEAIQEAITAHFFNRAAAEATSDNSPEL